MLLESPSVTSWSYDRLVQRQGVCAPPYTSTMASLAPSMKRTTEINVSITQGSWRSARNAAKVVIHHERITANEVVRRQNANEPQVGGNGWADVG